MRRRGVNMRRDARRRFEGIVSHDIPRLKLPEFGILCRRRDDRRHDAHRWFVGVVTERMWFMVRQDILALLSDVSWTTPTVTDE
jgi:hypothetical protein